MINRRSVLKAVAGLSPLLLPATASAGPVLRPGERFVDVPGGRVWTNVVGGGSRTPLLVLHGGPGAGHDYLESLGDLAADRPVVFFDQLGCGRSDKPDNPSLWRVDRFVTEVETVRRALGLRNFHLYGHSWGGWLAIEYLLRHPRAASAVVLASTSAGAPQFVAGTRQLRSLLPAEVQRVLDYYEARGEYTAPEYLEAVGVFYMNYFCRLDPYPEALLRSAANVEGNQVYATMNGPNEFVMTGNLKSWDRTAQVCQIRNPVLLTRGRYDEFTVDCTDTLQQHLPRAERAEFPNSAHMSMWEDRQDYMRTIASFLAKWD
ncbi:proline iminopeptidase-family hydrolase [Lentzea sp. NPDC051213]|uniref:proline iminopeptidase-family hydrolase n=1 Tax=Lentzea sp. NPDC051213 TaxID=3364126 RepID=UPI0037AC534C